MRAVMLASVTMCLAVPSALPQNIGRGPNLNLNVGPAINAGPRISINPNVRYSPDLNYDRGNGQEPGSRVSKSARQPDAPEPGGKSVKRSGTGTTAVSDASYVAKEILVELNGSPGEDELNALSRRFRLTRVQSKTLELTGSTFYRWRTADNRPVDTIVRDLTVSGAVKSAQRNNIFRLQQGAASSSRPAKSEPDPVQYGIAKLKLTQAHALSVGADVRVAVVDSGIDAAHPELAGTIVAQFDAIDSKEGAHSHGTSIAGIIGAHGRLTGAAPSVRVIAIRAFGAQQSGAQSTTFAILKSLDFAAANKAQIVNMSFAGPRDTAMERGLSAIAAKGIVLVAAAGNAGAKSPPLYPGADRNVIAVTATDQSDALFAQSNRGDYIAIAAPGVDILAPVPDGKYKMSSGTSVSAAFVSGIVALMLARNPALTPDDVRLALTSSAHDLGPPGRDAQYGAGEADAFAAVSMVSPPLATASERSPERN